MNNNFLFIFLFAALVGWFIIMPNYHGENLSFITTENIVNSGGNFITVKGKGDFTWNFTFTRPVNQTLVFFDKGSTSIEKTSFTYFTALNKDEYKKFLDIKKCKTCPAPFLNRKMRMFFIVTGDTRIKDILDSCKRGDYLGLYGTYLKVKINSEKHNRVDFSLPPRANFVYVNGLERY